MTDYLCVFKRYEKKYLITQSQYAEIRSFVSPYMEDDKYGRSTVCNLYYDTDDYRLIRASLEKPVYKEKLRLRSYGTASPDSTVFLELKKKYKGVVYKRRVPLTVFQAKEFFESGEVFGDYPQVFREINWFMDMYKPSPKVFIAYDRLAMFGKDAPDLRLTFDENIRWRTSDLDLTRDAHGFPELSGGLGLMEIKIPGAMPLWLADMLDAMELYPTSFSKYGFCYSNFIVNNTQPNGGFICA